MHLKKHSGIFISGLILGAILVGLFSFNFPKDNPNVQVENNRPQYRWYPPETPRNLAFAGERVPLERPEIREIFEKQFISNTYYHSHTLFILKLSKRIFPVLEKKLKENGIPDDFKYLCVAESSLQNLVSPAGARGYWQFMPATAKQYGLEVNREVDKRYDLEEATDAACQYLRSAYQKLGSWTAAAASYNMGVGGYSSRAATQKSSSYYDLWLPDETNNYLFRILSLKIILQEPQKYGFYIPEEDYYNPIPYQGITVKQSIPDLSVFAQSYGTNYKTLRSMNPWLQANSLTISVGNSYLIKLPLK